MPSKEYIHQPLGQEIAAIAGRYVLEEELRLSFMGREVLCLIGQAAFDTACCGSGGCGYAVVPGFVKGWKIKQSASGEMVSEVEPVEEEAERREIESQLLGLDSVHQVNFW